MKTAFSRQDHAFMRQALRLAARGRGHVEPNPMVGAVIVRNGRLIASGYHHRFGEPHAEPNALRAAGRRARGATLYVTLEPCCHFGKTPPCTAAILHAGIARVVCAMVDPFAPVRGKGIRLLRAAGLTVDVGLEESAARALNAPFLTRLAQGRPWVIAKWAQSLDGCVATAAGESQWISSETSRADVQITRGRMDAIIVGLNTVRQDDPLLMARPHSARHLRRLATRVVFDSQCHLPPACQLLRTIAFAPLMVVHSAQLNPAAQRRRQRLADAGVLTVAVPPDRTGRPQIKAFLRHLGARDYTNVLLEGGPELLASFLHAGLVDEAHVYLAPILLGGPARHAVAGPGVACLKDVLRLELRAIERFGADLKLTFRTAPSR